MNRESIARARQISIAQWLTVPWPFMGFKLPMSDCTEDEIMEIIDALEDRLDLRRAQVKEYFSHKAEVLPLPSQET